METKKEFENLKEEIEKLSQAIEEAKELWLFFLLGALF